MLILGIKFKSYAFFDFFYIILLFLFKFSSCRLLLNKNLKTKGPIENVHVRSKRLNKISFFIKKFQNKLRKILILKISVFVSEPKVSSLLLTANKRKKITLFAVSNNEQKGENVIMFEGTKK